MSIGLATVGAFVVSAALIIALRRFALPLGLMDHPGGRKSHALPVPVVGGVAMYVGIAPYILATVPAPAGPALAAGLALLVAVGILDDRFALRPRYRFIAEICAALLLTWSGQAVAYIGNLFGIGGIHTGVLGVAFSVVCYVGLANAVNMIDGIDGLAASLALVAIVFFTAVAAAQDASFVMLVGFAAIGAIAAFLCFNLPTPMRARAAVFMGDAGSMFIGCLLAWFAIVLAGQGPARLTPIGAVWILAVPLLDMGSVMLHRLRQGRSPFDGDRRHLHYRMVDSGISVARTVALLACISAVCGLIGIGFPLLRIPEWAMFCAFLAAWYAAYRAVSRAPLSAADPSNASRTESIFESGSPDA